MKIVFKIPVARVDITKISTSGKGSAGIKLTNLMRVNHPHDTIEHALEGDSIELTGTFNVQAKWWEVFMASVMRRPLKVVVTGDVKGSK